MISDLAFVHITKTGGSSIEEWGMAHGYRWGIHDPGLRGKELAKNLRNKSGIPCTSKWHVPPRYFAVNPYTGRRTFTVVRNPYTRLVSEFFCPFAGVREKRPTRAFFNRWIRDLVRQDNIVSGLPQAEYLPVDHVLKFETLERDFENLCGGQLPHLNKATSHRFTVEHLDEETKRLVQQRYHRDFQLFGYSQTKTSNALNLM
jgi:hypothetical protein